MLSKLTFIIWNKIHYFLTNSKLIVFFKDPFPSSLGSRTQKRLYRQDMMLQLWFKKLQGTAFWTASSLMKGSSLGLNVESEDLSAVLHSFQWEKMPSPYPYHWSPKWVVSEVVYWKWGRSPVLDHAHGHPVYWVHVLPNEVLEHNEGLHQEILKQ